MLSTGFFSSIIIFFLWGFYLPTYYIIQNKQQELAQLQAQQKQFMHVATGYEKATTKKTMLVNQFNQLTLHKRLLQQIIGSILDDMRSSGVSCRGIEPHSQQPKGFYEKHNLSICGKGDFKQILTFLHTLALSNQVLKFKSLSLDKSKHQLLNFQCVIQVMSVKEMSFDETKKDRT